MKIKVGARADSSGDIYAIWEKWNGSAWEDIRTPVFIDATWAAATVLHFMAKSYGVLGDASSIIIDNVVVRDYDHDGVTPWEP